MTTLVPKRLTMRDVSFLLSLAFKNLTRHLRRTVITAASLALGLAVYLLANSLLTGLEQDGVRNLVWYETGAVQVQERSWWDDRLFFPLEKTLAEPEVLAEKIRKAGYEAAVRTQFSGELIVAKDPYPESGISRSILTAINPGEDEKVFRIKNTLVAGRWFEPGEEGVVLGQGMAEELGAQPGWPVTIRTRTPEGIWQTMDFPVLGIILTPNALVNRMHVYLDRQVAGEYLQLGESATLVALGTGDWEDEGALVGKVRDIVGPDVRVLGWKTLGADFLTFVQSRSNLSLVILFLVGIIAAVGVSNTMLLTVLERTRELGMLRAQGLHDKEIFWGLVLEAGAIGFLGGMAGILLASLLNIPLAGQGIDLTPFLSQVNLSLPMTGVLRGSWSLKAYLPALVSGIGLSVLVSIFPIRHALDMEITEALGHR